MKNQIFTQSFFVLILIMISTSVGFSQVLATTKDGKEVILKEDGTWSYSEAAPAVTDQSSKDFDYSCMNIIETTTDKMTGDTVDALSENIIVSDDGGKTGFAVMPYRYAKAAVLAFKVLGDAGCIDDDSKMHILFRDGSRTEIVNNGKFNCDGKFTVIMGSHFGNLKVVLTLVEKQIDAIRVSGTSGKVERSLSEHQSRLLQKSLECLSVGV